jgi:hypothetical protein
MSHSALTPILSPSTLLSCSLNRGVKFSPSFFFLPLFSIDRQSCYFGSNNLSFDKNLPALFVVTQLVPVSELLFGHLKDGIGWNVVEGSFGTGEFGSLIVQGGRKETWRGGA